MAKSVWDATLDVDNKLDRNGYDLTHSYNFSTGFGRLVPVFCARCAPKSSFRINPAFGLQFMPMQFPVQTDMQARISFFKYPLRALYKDYKDLVGGFRQGLEQPYIDFKDSFEKMVGVGKIADYLNVPVTKVGGYGSGVVCSFPSSDLKSYVFSSENVLEDLTTTSISSPYIFRGVVSDLPSSLVSSGDAVSLTLLNPSPMAFVSSVNGDDFTSDNVDFYQVIMNTKFFVCFLDDAGKVLSSSGQSFPAVQMNDSSGLPGFKPGFTYSAENIIHSPVTFSVPAGATKVFCGISYAVNGEVVKSPSAWLNNFLPYLSLSPDFNVSFYLAIQDAESSSDVEEITRQTSPYYDSSSTYSSKQLKLSAYPFRAYEGIYNAYYRDIRNNPYILNGQEEYNVFIPNDKGGADTLTA